MKRILAFFSMVAALMVSMPLLSQDEIGDIPPPPAPEQSMWHTFVLIGIALLFFYFILWRPEQKRRKALEEARSSLSKGTRVVAMGIIGEVVREHENTVILKMVDGAKIEFLKQAISEVLPPDSDGKKEEK